MAEIAPKRRRVVEDERKEMSLDDLEDDAPAYVPLKKRREQQMAQLASKNKGVLSMLEQQEQARKAAEEEELLRKARQKHATLLQEAQEVKKLKEIESAWLAGSLQPRSS